MTAPPRILNITNGFTLKRSQAARAIENCSAAWVEYGVSVRNLTLAEAIQARNEQAQRREPLPYAELPGLHFVPALSGADATRAEGKLMWEAHDFVMKAA